MTRNALRLLIPVVWAAGMFGARSHPWLSIGSAAGVLAVILLVGGAMPRRALFVPTWMNGALALLAAAAMIGVTALISPALLAAFPSIREMGAEIYRSLLEGQGTLAALAFVVPVVIIEEIVWRGAFHDVLLMRSRTMTAIVAAAVYAAAHAPFGSILLVAVAFICGVYWSALRAWSGSLVPSLVSHLAWDVALIVAPLVAAR